MFESLASAAFSGQHFHPVARVEIVLEETQARAGGVDVALPVPISKGRGYTLSKWSPLSDCRLTSLMALMALRNPTGGAFEINFSLRGVSTTSV